MSQKEKQVSLMNTKMAGFHLAASVSRSTHHWCWLTVRLAKNKTIISNNCSFHSVTSLLKKGCCHSLDKCRHTLPKYDFPKNDTDIKTKTIKTMYQFIIWHTNLVLLILFQLLQLFRSAHHNHTKGNSIQWFRCVYSYSFITSLRSSVFVNCRCSILHTEVLKQTMN